ncbi:hypothetical protein GOODEAATRI_024596 [Goodea atripinnis]|uniref:Fibronectin type-III domain-containing protein n=1 Tax=Goodea atripinnis TaxID=208336 RepID=A0ABV0MKL6_9TELE
MKRPPDKMDVIAARHQQACREQPSPPESSCVEERRSDKEMGGRAPSLISELRVEKIEEKSITLVWREPSYPNSSRTEYEVKYYEKVKEPLEPFWS